LEIGLRFDWKSRPEQAGGKGYGRTVKWEDGFLNPKTADDA
jgi:hypothetical protein